MLIDKKTASNPRHIFLNTDEVNEAMRQRLKEIARAILPPFLVSLLRPANRSIAYSGPYPTWAEALRHSVGYDNSAILEAVRKSALAVKNGKASFERDSLTFDEPDYRWPMLACLLHIALVKRPVNSPLHVVDFGGSLGSVYFQHRLFFDNLPQLLWSVVEQPNFVECGKVDFANERLQFFTDISDTLTRAPIDVILFAGSLQCIEKPQEILRQAASVGAMYLILDRLWVIDGADDRIDVIHVKPPLFNASYPMYKFSRQKLTTALNDLGYATIASFSSGYLCRRISDQRLSA